MRFLRWAARWTLHALTLLSALVLCVIIALLLMNLHQQRRARALLEEFRTLQPGKTSAEEAIKLARRFDFDSESAVWIEQADDLQRIGRERLGDCENANCDLSISLLFPGQYVGRDWFPRFNPALNRFLPLHLLYVRIRLSGGTVSGLAATLESLDEDPAFEAAGVMYPVAIVAPGTPRPGTSADVPELSRADIGAAGSTR